MDLFYEISGLFFVLLGIAGSFLPVLPGPLTGWVGLLLLHLSERVPDDSNFLIITFCIALGVFLLDYIIPDFVHVLYNGKIVKSGTKELAKELEAKGYDWIKKEVAG